MIEKKFHGGDKVEINKALIKDGTNRLGEIFMRHTINGMIFYDVKLENGKVVFGIIEKMLKPVDSEKK